MYSASRGRMTVPQIFTNGTCGSGSDDLFALDANRRWAAGRKGRCLIGCGRSPRGGRPFAFYLPTAVDVAIRYPRPGYKRPQQSGEPVTTIEQLDEAMETTINIKAKWNGRVIAESPEVIVVDGYSYFQAWSTPIIESRI